MILATLRHYLQERGEASLQEIALYLESDPDAVRGMLELWLRKGRVARRKLDGACGGSCCKCPAEVTELYSWKGAKGSQQTGCRPIT